MYRNLKQWMMVALAIGAMGCASQRSNTYYADSCDTCTTQCEGPRACVECTDGRYVRVTRSMPTEIPLGQDFRVKLVATANSDCTDVVIRETVPEGLTYVGSTPVAVQNGDELSWALGKIKCGECKDLCVTYRPMAEGCYTSCYTVAAEPCCCQCIRVGCPKLSICKYGDECVRLGCPVNYTIVVSNEGTMIAQDVTLEDEVPAELQHRSCCKHLKWDLGDLCPGDCKRVNVCFDTIQCGQTTNLARAAACGCPPVTDTATTLIDFCCIKLDKTGPCGPIIVGQTADYKITATNESNIALCNVEVTDTIPGGTRFVKAPGAKVSGTTAIWTIEDFGPGQTKTFDLTITSCVPGCLTNRACVKCVRNGCEEVGDCACWSTEWVGIPGMWIGIKDEPGVICVGNATTYCINVQNQGFADDKNIKLVVTFPSELEPLAARSSCGEYRIEGRKVIFDTIPILQPGRTVEFSIQAKGVKPGDARVKAEVTSDLIKDPVVNEESTQVY